MGSTDSKLSGHEVSWIAKVRSRAVGHIHAVFSYPRVLVKIGPHFSGAILDVYLNLAVIQS